MDVTMKGYLTKEKKTGTKRLSLRYGSKRRWFQLEGQELRYYESEENSKEKKHEGLRGFISVFDIQSVRKLSTSNRPNTFQIVTRRKGSLALTADTEEVTDKWITMIQLAMRLKRSTVSISEVLRGSVTEDSLGANSSDEEFWDKDFPIEMLDEQNFYSTLTDSKDAAKTDCDDDVFVGNEKKRLSERKDYHIYDEINLENVKKTEVIDHLSVVADDGDAAAERSADVKSTVADDVLDEKSRDTYRESGYETTEHSDAADYIDNGATESTIGAGKILEDTDTTGDKTIEHVNDGQEEEKDDDDASAVHVLKDLIRKTVISEFQEEIDIMEQEEQHEGVETAHSTEEQGASAFDQLRAMLGNDL